MCERVRREFRDVVVAAVRNFPWDGETGRPRALGALKAVFLTLCLCVLSGDHGGGWGREGGHKKGKGTVRTSNKTTTQSTSRNAERAKRNERNGRRAKKEGGGETQASKRRRGGKEGGPCKLYQKGKKTRRTIPKPPHKSSVPLSTLGVTGSFLPSLVRPPRHLMYNPPHTHSLARQSSSSERSAATTSPLCCLSRCSALALSTSSSCTM